MFRNRLLILAGANFVIFAGITLILPLLPEIQERNGLSTAELGLVAGVAFFSGLIGQLGLARFVDRGYARHLLLASVVMTVGALVVIALSNGLWDLVLGRFLEGLGYTMFAPAAKAIVAAHDPHRVGTNLGRLSGAELAGLVVGPMVGAVLANAFDLRVPFFVLAGAVVLLIPAIVRLDLTGMTVHRESTTPVRTLIRRPFVIRAALLYLAMILPSGVYDVLWAKLLSDRGASLTLIGLSFTIYGIPYVAFADLRVAPDRPDRGDPGVGHRAGGDAAAGHPLRVHRGAHRARAGRDDRGGGERVLDPGVAVRDGRGVPPGGDRHGAGHLGRGGDRRGRRGGGDRRAALRLVRRARRPSSPRP